MNIRNMTGGEVSIDYAVQWPQMVVHVCRWRVLQTWQHDAMASPFWRWYWNANSGAWVKRGQQRVDLQPNTWCLIPPGDPLETDLDNDVQHFFVHFSLEASWQNQCQSMVTGPMASADQQFLLQLFNENQHNEQSAGLMIMHCVYQALAQIEPERWQNKAQHPLIQEVLNLVHMRKGVGVSLHNLAERVSLHEKSLSRLFKKEVGVSLGQYAMRIRIDAVATDIHHGSDSVEDLALQYGFCDRYHLTRVMKKHLQCTPGQLRKQRLES